MSRRRPLVLERRNQENQTPVTPLLGGGALMMSPELDEDYWTYRVQLTSKQAVVGFPKFSTIGVGFARERENGYNTNLPYNCPTEDILKHIKSNEGSSRIDDADVFEAIRMIQWAALGDRMRERRSLLAVARDVDYRLPFPPRLADDMGQGLNTSLRELDMLIAEATGLREQNRVLRDSEDAHAVFLRSELDRANAELEVLRKGVAVLSELTVELQAQRDQVLVACATTPEVELDTLPQRVREAYGLPTTLAVHMVGGLIPMVVPAPTEEARLYEPETCPDSGCVFHTFRHVHPVDIAAKCGAVWPGGHDGLQPPTCVGPVVHSEEEWHTAPYEGVDPYRLDYQWSPKAYAHDGTPYPHSSHAVGPADPNEEEFE